MDIEVFVAVLPWVEIPEPSKEGDAGEDALRSLLDIGRQELLADRAPGLNFWFWGRRKQFSIAFPGMIPEDAKEGLFAFASALRQEAKSAWVGMLTEAWLKCLPLREVRGPLLPARLHPDREEGLMALLVHTPTRSGWSGMWRFGRGKRGEAIFGEPPVVWEAGEKTMGSLWDTLTNREPAPGDMRGVAQKVLGELEKGDEPFAFSLRVVLNPSVH